MAISLEDRVRLLESQMANVLSENCKAPVTKDWRRTLGRFTGDSLMHQIDEDALRLRELERIQISAEGSES